MADALILASVITFVLYMIYEVSGAERLIEKIKDKLNKK